MPVPHTELRFVPRSPHLVRARDGPPRSRWTAPVNAVTWGLVSTAPRRISRYVVYEELASGGMGAVHYGKVAGSAGFSRAVAIKRLHAHFAKDESFRAMLVDEAHLAARIRRPNVVPTIDVVEGDDGELLLIMEFVVGEALSRLLRTSIDRGEAIPISVAASIIVDVLHGLHAAHDATGARGEVLGIVHRDVSPQNVLVGGRPRSRRRLRHRESSGAPASHRRRRDQGKGRLHVAGADPRRARRSAHRRVRRVRRAVELLTSQRLFDADSQNRGHDEDPSAARFRRASSAPRCRPRSKPS